MTSALSFRKESIQPSSSASASIHRPQDVAPGVHGLKAAHEQRNVAITTTITLTIPTL